MNNLLVLQNFSIARKSGNILFTYWKHFFRPTLVRVWNVGRYPTFHTLTSVGRKICFQYVKRMFPLPFFAYLEIIKKTGNCRKSSNWLSLEKALPNKPHPRTKNCYWTPLKMLLNPPLPVDFCHIRPHWRFIVLAKWRSCCCIEEEDENIVINWYLNYSFYIRSKNNVEIDYFKYIIIRKIYRCNLCEALLVVSVVRHLSALLGRQRCVWRISWQVLSLFGGFRVTCISTFLFSYSVYKVLTLC